MPMIQGIDAGALLNAFRAGRGDRYEDNKRKSAMERDKQISGLMGQLFGTPATVESQFAPSNPTQPQTFEQAFTPEGIAQAGPPAPVAPPRGRPDPNVLGKLIALDPETGGKIVTAFKSLDEMDLKRTEAKNTMMGAAARTLAKVPPQERAQMLRLIAPQLMEAGFTEQELAQADLSDNGLRMLEATAIDLDKMIDNELAEREFRMGKTVPVTAGGSVASIRPQMDERGNVIGTTQEYVVGGGSAPTNLPRPQSKAEVDALPAGAQFIAPDGTVRTKPGGGVGNGTGGFPQ